jgi:hypothetical protein
VTGEVKAAVEVEAVEVEAPSIDHSYTDLLALTFVVFGCCCAERTNVRPIPLVRRYAR